MRYENTCNEVVLVVNATQVPPLKPNRRWDLESKWQSVITQHLVLITLHLNADAHKV